MVAATPDRSLRRVIVHCGAQKTGSTALHHFVQKNQETLQPFVRILTPKKGSLTREVGRLCGLYSLDPQAHLAELETALTALRDEILNTHGTCIVSHENICGAMMGRAGVRSLYPMLPEILTLMDTVLAPLAPEYVFYTRDMAPWKVSVHNQAVKSDRYQGTLDTFLAETRDSETWDALALRLQGRLRMFRLEDEPDRARPGQQLLRMAGVPQAALDGLAPVQGARNVSLNAGALEFMRQLNGLDLGPAAMRQVGNLIKTNQSLFADARAN